MKRRSSSWLVLLVILTCSLFAMRARAGCTTQNTRAQTMFWDDSAPAITLIVPQELAANMQQAANQWNSSCAGGTMRSAPPFDVQVGDARLPGQTEGNSILVVITQDLPADSNAQNEYGGWHRGGFYDGPVSTTGPTIHISQVDENGNRRNLQSPSEIAELTHELGHALGLYHDKPDDNGEPCPSGIMGKGPWNTGAILDTYCSAIRAIQAPDCNAISVPPTSQWGPLATNGVGGRLSGCPAGCTCPDSNTPDPIDGLTVCDRFPEACPGGGDVPWWDSNPFETDWGVSCGVVTVTDETGAVVSFGVDCHVIYYYLRAGATSTEPDLSRFDGNGPRMRIDNFPDGTTLTAPLEIRGSAASAVGVAGVAVCIDDQPATLANFRTGLTSTNCADVDGVADPDCPNVGFSGILDPSTLTEGQHVLQIVTFDRRNPYPRPSMLTRRFTVPHACGDPVLPTVAITAPDANATVSGALQLAATANDNIGVSQVDFYVDGSLIGTDRTAPYEYRWNTTAVRDGAHAISARAVDNCGNVKFTGITITIDNEQQAPRARNDRAETNIGVGVVIDVLKNDSDPDGQAIALDANPIVVAPRNGTATRESGTSIRYVPVAGFSGNDGFRYKISDSSGASDTAWVTVEVSGVNHAPVANDDSASGRTNRAITIDVLANDTDADGDLLSLVGSGITQPPLHGRAERVSRTSVSYAPGNGFTGVDRFQYEIGDGKGRRSRAWVKVTITDMNAPPVANADSASTSGTSPVTIDVTANDSDPDGDLVLLISKPITISPLHGAAAKASGSSIVYTPDGNYTGTDTFQYEIGDGNGKRARANVTVTIAAQNNAPIAQNDAAGTLTNTAVSINVTTNDSDPDGDRVTVSAITTAPPNGTAVKISASTITYTPRANFSGTDSFQYEIDDGRGLKARATVTVTVASSGGSNQNPVAADDFVTTRRDGIIDINVTANDTDPDGDPVTLITSPIVVAPANGTAAKVSGSTIRYTPQSNWVGTAKFLYEAGDGRGLRTRAWVTVTVSDANNRPIGSDDTARVAPGSEVSINVTANDTDPDGDSVTLISNPVVSPALHGSTVKINGSTIKYTPSAGYYGTDRFQYEAGDGHGARTRAWVDVTVTYEVVWAAYEIANMPPAAINDLIVSRQSETVLNVVTNDDDPDHDYLVLTPNPIVTPPQSGTIRRVSDTELAYTPNAGFGGNDGFEYEVADPNGVTSRAWVAVNVPAENQPPVAVNDTALIAAGRQAILGVLANDTDADRDELTLTEVALATYPQHGIARRISSRELAYLPNDGFTGVDTFAYEVTDGHGATARATVTLTVTDQNIAPVAVADAFATDAGVATSVAVLANDSDANGDALRVVSSSQPAHGYVTWDPDPAAAGVYMPQPGFVGVDTFTYTISDAAGLEATATATVTVRQLKRAPIVANDSAETKTLTAVLIGVLANDWDPDGDRLTVKSVSTPAAGTVTINRAGESLTFTPAQGQAGTVTFTYVAADPSGLQATGTVTVKVLNEVPLARNDSFAAIEDTYVSYSGAQFLANDTDADGQELKIISATQPANGTLLTSPDFGSFSYKPKANWYGIDGFYYTVSDGFGGTAQAWVQLSVSAVNDPPVANPDTFSVYKNQVLTMTQAQIVANDTDIEGHTISVYSVGAATNGTTALLANGSVEYRPYGEFTGTDAFDYIATDSGGNAYSTGRITVNVLQDSKPVANFVVTCTGRSCVFDASSSTDDRGIVTYQWTLGNNQAAGGKTFTYAYPIGGMYQVRLTVQDVLGQTSAVTKYVTVTEPPPDARDDSFSWRKGYARYVDYASMLANDVDPNNDALTVQSVDSSLTDGTVTCDSTGCLFTPPSSYWYGQTSFKYTVSDGHGAT
ncbi:MAG TPA: Ig-like domain-containing protein, partial [Thermoanaerobaculia bacterium]|nr:Ig-like domain-containing protein [Thermoanaerobaculia bacterium]